LILGEGFELLSVVLPRSLAGKTLGESAIETRTGLSIIAIQQNGRMITHPDASTLLTKDGELVMLGSTKSRQAFAQAFSG
jgi:K+/H+ antiporter YhaU regulatory subunit KhtT